MKVISDNLAPQRGAGRTGGFSLAETIGTLSVMGLLAASLLPPIHGLVNKSRLNGAAQSYMIAKAAATRYLDHHQSKNPSADVRTLTADVDAATHWDSEVLRPAGFLAQPFATKISKNARLAISAAPPASASPTVSNRAYSFTGLTPTDTTTTAGSLVVVEAVLEQVSLEDARALNERIDGNEEEAGANLPGTNLTGRVKYDFGKAKRGPVRLYVTHR